MNNFEKLKKELISAAKAAGIEEYEIYYQSESDVGTETLKNEISSFTFGTSAGICFRCIIDGKIGYASTKLMETEEMKELVRRAANNTKYIESDEMGIINSGSEKYGTKTSEYKPLPDVSMMKETALKIQGLNYKQSKFVTDGTQSGVMAYEEETRIYNSKGLDLSNKASMGGAYSAVIINKDGEPSQGFEFVGGFDAEKLKELPASAHADALSRLGAGEVNTGKYDIVISGKQMRSVLAAFWSAFSGRSIRLGTSLLCGKLGTKIASDCITICDDPFDPNCPIQTTFDAEGSAVYKKNVVENGILKTFLYDLSEASKSGVQSTANAYKASYSEPVSIRPYCFSIKPGKYSLEELFDITGNGIYVTEIKGLHAGANPATGDFSIESAGFMIENGKKGRPVKSFTIAGNFYDLLKNITHVENKADYGIPGDLNVFASPSLLIRNISVAGK